MVRTVFLYIISFGTPADWRCASTGRISSQDKTMAKTLNVGKMFEDFSS